MPDPVCGVHYSDVCPHHLYELRAAVTTLVRRVFREESGTERHVEEVEFADFVRRKKAFSG